MLRMNCFAMAHVCRSAAVVFTCMLIGCADSKPTDEADDYYAEAVQAVKSGDDSKALDMLSKSIEQKPMAWSYYQRGRIYVQQQKWDMAKADAEKALELDPNNLDMQWLQGEMEKPEDQRFKGRFKDPPSLRK